MNTPRTARLYGSSGTVAAGNQAVYHKYIFDQLAGTTNGRLYLRWSQSGLTSGGFIRVAVDEDGDTVAEKTWQGATAVDTDYFRNTWREFVSNEVDGSWNFEDGATVTITSDRNEIFSFIYANIDGIMFDARTTCDDDSDCDDSLYCNGVEECNLVTNTCISGIDPCPEDDGVFCNGVTTGCNETTNACINSGNPCTPDACNEETDSCEPIGECVTNEDCNDSLYCNGVEVCTGGSCFAGTPVNCSDADICTIDTCNETTNTCDHPIAKDTDEDTYIDDQCSGGDDCDDSDPTVNPGQYEGPLGDASCSDTMDNDCDTYIDLADSGCSAAGAATRVLIITTQ
jgi:hypothetical protein